MPALGARVSQAGGGNRDDRGQSATDPGGHSAQQ